MEVVPFAYDTANIAVFFALVTHGAIITIAELYIVDAYTVVAEVLKLTVFVVTLP